MPDCGFVNGNGWFRYRAAAIIIEDGCVLFAGNDRDDYLYSVGGAVHIGETAEDAVVREVFEETGLMYEIERLAVIHENFFNGDGGDLNGLECHEICLYFLMKPQGIKEINMKGITPSGAAEKMYWIPIQEIGSRKMFPSFMKEYLAKTHSGIEHIITDQRKRHHKGLYDIEGRLE